MGEGVLLAKPPIRGGSGGRSPLIRVREKKNEVSQLAESQLGRPKSPNSLKNELGEKSPIDRLQPFQWKLTATSRKMMIRIIKKILEKMTKHLLLQQ